MSKKSDEELDEQPIEAKINALITLTADLTELLSAERAALAERDLETLAAVTDRKAGVCRQIELTTQALGPASLGDQIAAVDSEQRARLEPLHKTLVAQAQMSQEYNTVNGKIIHRSQQSVRELIKLMSGTDADLLYGESGQTLANATGTAIAKA